MASLVRSSGAAVWFFVLMGLIMLVGGLAWDASHSRFMSEAESVQGVVANAERRPLGRRGRTYSVTVRYEIDGKAYGRILSGGREFSSIRAGDKMTIYYRPSNPSRIVIRRSQGVLLIAAGAIFTVLGIIFVVQYKKTNEVIDWLKERGRTVYAEVTSVEKKSKKTEISFITCVSKNPATGQIEATYETRSGKDNLRRYIGRQVAVYVHPNDSSKYYLDLV
jgi:hypothetical protein